MRRGPTATIAIVALTLALRLDAASALGTSVKTQPEDCAVYDAVLETFSREARKPGTQWGFTTSRFVIADTTKSFRPADLPLTRFNFTTAENTIYDRLKQQVIFSSFVKRAGLRRPIRTCDLPKSFSFAPEPLPRAPWFTFETEDRRHPDFEFADGFLRLSLPGYSSDDRRALVAVDGIYPIWSKAAIYHLTKQGDEWEVERVFVSYLHGE